MLRVIGAFSSLALAVAVPAWADHQGIGSGKGESHSGAHQSHGNRAESAKEAKAQGHRGKGESARAVAPGEAPARGWTNDSAQRLATIGACPPGLAKKNPECLPPGIANRGSDGWGPAYRPSLFGIPVPGGANYVYYDGYLIATGGDAPYIPLLGGALAVGQLWPERYPALPIADWQSRYYGFEDPGDYRFADNVIYRVDPDTDAIESVAALLTGTDFTVGSPLPPGYDVYNLPAPFRTRYPDSDAALYRFADGRIYEIDPATMLIAKSIELVL